MMKQILILCSATLLFANDIDVLTNTKQEIIKLKQEQIKEKKQVNKYNWLSNINLNSSITRDKEGIQRENSSLSLSQDIYRFGGISSQIEYSKQLELFEELTLDISTKQDVSNIFTLLLDIKQNEIDLKKNVLNIKNSQIDISHKKSEYQAGQVGISDLNEAIMTKNSLNENQKNLELSRQTNINSLKQYTNKSFNEIELPNIKLLEKDFFMKKAMSLKLSSINKEVKKSSYEVKKSDYLPSVKINGSYGYQSGDNIQSDDYLNYGLAVSLPLSYTARNDIQQTKLEYLISNKEFEKQKNDISIAYDEILLSIKSNKEKINLAKEDIKLYKELLLSIEEEYKAGYKTMDDLESLKNSMLIRQLDIKLYELNIEKEYINLYSRVL